MSITTLVVDDHAGFRTSAGVLLQMDGFEVVGEAADGAAAISAAESLRPEFVLLDVQLPDSEGFDVFREILAKGFCSVRSPTSMSRRSGQPRSAASRTSS
jgi:DNA-binding NarL/FixJ family response regulator